ncbi:MAG: hypothetical protein KY460_08890 [Actinobacteria bacterium]|nr:hypothetical protein [Actinomycetota bacterium]
MPTRPVFLELDELGAVLRDPTHPTPELTRRRGEHLWCRGEARAGLPRPSPGADAVVAGGARQVPVDGGAGIVEFT